MNETDRTPRAVRNLVEAWRRTAKRFRRTFDTVTRRVSRYSQRGRLQRLIVISAGVALSLLVVGLFLIFSLQSGGWLRVFWVRAEPEIIAAIQDLLGISPAGEQFTIPRATLVEHFRVWLASRPFAEGLRWILLLVVPVLVAFWLAAYYLEFVFKLTSHTTARKRLARQILPFMPESVTVKEGNILPGGSSAPFFRMGGPVRMEIQPGNVVVLERVRKGIRILGQAKPGVRVGFFERLRTILDLREKSLLVNIEDRTQDGILIAARHAHFHYHISRGRHESGQGTAFDRNVVEQLVFRHWVGGDWENPEKRLLDMAALVESELRSFVRGRRLMDFLAFLPQASELKVESKRHLNPFKQFADEFSQNAGKFPGQVGPALFQFEWTGQGEWVLLPDIDLDEHTDEWLLAFQNELHSQPEALERLRNETRQAEFQRLVREALEESLRSLHSTTVRETKRKILQTYRQKFETALKSKLATDKRLREDLKDAIDQINRLAP